MSLDRLRKQPIPWTTVLTAGGIATVAVLVSLLAGRIDEQLNACGTGVFVDGKCECVHPYAGTHCELVDCGYGQLVDSVWDVSQITTPMGNVPSGCKCESQYWGFNCLNCTSMMQDGCNGPCKQDYYGPRCEVLCREGTAENAEGVNHRESGGTYRHHVEGRGMCLRDGSVRCNEGTAGLDCSIDCKACKYGSCNKMTGECDCFAGVAGELCDKECPGRCSGNNGKCVWDGEYAECECALKHTGLDCSLDCCARGNRTDLGVTHGDCAINVGGCVCDAGWEGDECDCNAEKTCGGRGSCLASGACNCSRNFQGRNCEMCADDRIGPFCQYNKYSCPDNPGHGVVVALNAHGDYGCKCDAGFTGDTCEECMPAAYPKSGAQKCEFIVPDSMCHNGHVKEDYAGLGVMCVCEGNFAAASDCASCKEHYFGSKCDVRCDASCQESGGRCGHTPEPGCQCPRGMRDVGGRCVVCGGDGGCKHGECYGGRCECDGGWYGDHCDITAPQYRGKTCNGANGVPLVHKETASCSSTDDCTDTRHSNPANAQVALRAEKYLRTMFCYRSDVPSDLRSVIGCCVDDNADGKCDAAHLTDDAEECEAAFGEMVEDICDSRVLEGEVNVYEWCLARQRNCVKNGTCADPDFCADRCDAGLTPSQWQTRWEIDHAHTMSDLMSQPWRFPISFDDPYVYRPAYVDASLNDVCAVGELYNTCVDNLIPSDAAVYNVSKKYVNGEWLPMPSYDRCGLVKHVKELHVDGNRTVVFPKTYVERMKMVSDPETTIAYGRLGDSDEAYYGEVNAEIDRMTLFGRGTVEVVMYNYTDQTCEDFLMRSAEHYMDCQQIRVYELDYRWGAFCAWREALEGDGGFDQRCYDQSRVCVGCEDYQEGCEGLPLDAAPMPDPCVADWDGFCSVFMDTERNVQGTCAYSDCECTGYGIGGESCGLSCPVPQFTGDDKPCGEGETVPWGICVPDSGAIAFGYEQGKCECFNGGNPAEGCALMCEGEQDCSVDVDTPVTIETLACDYANVQSIEGSGWAQVGAKNAYFSGVLGYNRSLCNMADEEAVGVCLTGPRCDVNVSYVQLPQEESCLDTTDPSIVYFEIPKVPKVTYTFEHNGYCTKVTGWMIDGGTVNSLEDCANSCWGVRTDTGKVIRAFTINDGNCWCTANPPMPHEDCGGTVDADLGWITYAIEPPKDFPISYRLDHDGYCVPYDDTWQRYMGTKFTLEGCNRACWGKLTIGTHVNLEGVEVRRKMRAFTYKPHANVTQIDNHFCQLWGTDGEDTFRYDAGPQDTAIKCGDACSNAFYAGDLGDSTGVTKIWASWRAALPEASKECYCHKTWADCTDDMFPIPESTSTAFAFHVLDIALPGLTTPTNAATTEGYCWCTSNPSPEKVTITSAEQSSDFFSTNNGNFFPEHAIDGDLSTMSHTKGGEGNANWLQFNLEAGVQNLSYVRIWNRQDCCQDKLDEFVIEWTDKNYTLAPYVFITGGDGEKTCEEAGYEDVESHDECEVAAKFLLGEDVTIDSLNLAHRPSPCYYHAGSFDRVFLNSHSGGHDVDADPDRHRICRTSLIANMESLLTLEQLHTFMWTPCGTYTHTVATVRDFACEVTSDANITAVRIRKTSNAAGQNLHLAEVEIYGDPDCHIVDDTPSYVQAIADGHKCFVDNNIDGNNNIIQSENQGGFELNGCAEICKWTDGFIWKSINNGCYCTTGTIEGCTTTPNTWKQYRYITESSWKTYVIERDDCVDHGFVVGRDEPESIVCHSPNITLLDEDTLDVHVYGDAPTAVAYVAPGVHCAHGTVPPLTKGYFLTEGGAYCNDGMSLSVGGFPPHLQPGDPLYSADKAEECMNRCLADYPDAGGFYLRTNPEHSLSYDRQCKCATKCDERTDEFQYDAYKIETILRDHTSCTHACVGYEFYSVDVNASVPCICFNSTCGEGASGGSLYRYYNTPPNPGSTPESREMACFEACRDRTTGTWRDDTVVSGFVLNPETGHCGCTETNVSCPGAGYKGYDMQGAQCTPRAPHLSLTETEESVVRDVTFWGVPLQNINCTILLPDSMCNYWRGRCECAQPFTALTKKNVPVHLNPYGSYRVALMQGYDIDEYVPFMTYQPHVPSALVKLSEDRFCGDIYKYSPTNEFTCTKCLGSTLTRNAEIVSDSNGLRCRDYDTSMCGTADLFRQHARIQTGVCETSSVMSKTLASIDSWNMLSECEIAGNALGLNGKRTFVTSSDHQGCLYDGEETKMYGLVYDKDGEVCDPGTLCYIHWEPQDLVADTRVLLGACQGDCDTDNDCMPGLKCWARQEGEEVPGCSGRIFSYDEDGTFLGNELFVGTTDICVPEESIWIDTVNGNDRTGNSATVDAFPPIIIDSDDYGNHPDAGVNGNPSYWSWGLWEKDGEEASFNIMNPSSSQTGHLLECMGDCDNNDHCAGDLICYHRSYGGTPPGCKGRVTDGMAFYQYPTTDICVRPDFIADNGYFGAIADTIDANLYHHTTESNVQNHIEEYGLITNADKMAEASVSVLDCGVNGKDCICKVADGTDIELFKSSRDCTVCGGGEEFVATSAFKNKDDECVCTPHEGVCNVESEGWSQYVERTVSYERVGNGLCGTSLKKQFTAVALEDKLSECATYCEQQLQYDGFGITKDNCACAAVDCELPENLEYETFLFNSRWDGYEDDLARFFNSGSPNLKCFKDLAHTEEVPCDWIRALKHFARGTSYRAENCDVLVPGADEVHQVPCSGHGFSSSGTCACDYAEEFKIRGSGAGLTFEAPNLRQTPFRGKACNIVCPGYDMRSMQSVCSGHGLCASDGRCDCEQGWTADDCSLACENNPGPLTCSGHGTCDEREQWHRNDIVTQLQSMVCRTNEFIHLSTDRVVQVEDKLYYMVKETGGIQTYVFDIDASTYEKHTTVVDDYYITGYAYRRPYGTAFAQSTNSEHGSVRVPFMPCEDTIEIVRETYTSTFPFVDRADVLLKCNVKYGAHATGYNVHCGICTCEETSSTGNWTGYNCRTPALGFYGEDARRQCPGMTQDKRPCHGAGTCMWGSIDGFGEFFRSDAQCLCGDVTSEANYSTAPRDLEGNIIHHVSSFGTALYPDTLEYVFANGTECPEGLVLPSAEKCVSLSGSYVFGKCKKLGQIICVPGKSILTNYRSDCSCRYGFAGKRCDHERMSCLFSGDESPDGTECTCSHNLAYEQKKMLNEGCCSLGTYYEQKRYSTFSPLVDYIPLSDNVYYTEAYTRVCQPAPTVTSYDDDLQRILAIHNYVATTDIFQIVDTVPCDLKHTMSLYNAQYRYYTGTSSPLSLTIPKSRNGVQTCLTHCVTNKPDGGGYKGFTLSVYAEDVFYCHCEVDPARRGTFGPSSSLGGRYDILYPYVENECFLDTNGNVLQHEDAFGENDFEKQTGLRRMAVPTFVSAGTEETIPNIIALPHAVSSDDYSACFEACRHADAYYISVLQMNNAECKCLTDLTHGSRVYFDDTIRVRSDRDMPSQWTIDAITLDHAINECYALCNTKMEVSNIEHYMYAGFAVGASSNTCFSPLTSGGVNFNFHGKKGCDGARYSNGDHSNGYCDGSSSVLNDAQKTYYSNCCRTLGNPARCAEKWTDCYCLDELHHSDAPVGGMSYRADMIGVTYELPRTAHVYTEMPYLDEKIYVTSNDIEPPKNPLVCNIESYLSYGNIAGKTCNCPLWDYEPIYDEYAYIELGDGYCKNKALEIWGTTMEKCSRYCDLTPSCTAYSFYDGKCSVSSDGCDDSGEWYMNTEAWKRYRWDVLPESRQRCCKTGEIQQYNVSLDDARANLHSCMQNCSQNGKKTARPFWGDTFACFCGDHVYSHDTGYCDTDWSYGEGTTQVGNYKTRDTIQCSGELVVSCKRTVGCFCTKTKSSCGLENWNDNTDYSTVSCPQFEDFCDSTQYELLDSNNRSYVAHGAGTCGGSGRRYREIISKEDGVEGPTLEECKARCTADSQCHSVMYHDIPSDGRCWLSEVRDIDDCTLSSESNWDIYFKVAKHEDDALCECAGFYIRHGKTISCPSGKYMPKDGPCASSCRICPRGKFSDPGASECTGCRAGRIQTGLTECSDCPIGFSSISGDTTCIACIPGKFSFSGGLCIYCPVGYVSSGGASSCAECSLGTYAVSGVEYCKSCAAGQYSDVLHVDTCKKCEVGRFGPELGQTSTGACIECPPGRYQAIEGADACPMCPSGYFSETMVGFGIDPTSCKRCDAGQYMPNAGNIRVNQYWGCIECEAGKYQRSGGATFCENCPSGFYNRALTYPKDGCLRCWGGSYQDERGRSTCKLCPIMIIPGATEWSPNPIRVGLEACVPIVIATGDDGDWDQYAIWNPNPNP